MLRGEPKGHDVTQQRVEHADDSQRTVRAEVPVRIVVVRQTRMAVVVDQRLIALRPRPIVVRMLHRRSSKIKVNERQAFNSQVKSSMAS